MRKQKGFTLIELLVVVSIIMMIMLLVIPNVTSKLKGIKEKGCEALLSVINSQIQLFEINEGYLPSSLNDLIEEGYITEKQAICPTGGTITIISGEAFCE